MITISQIHAKIAEAIKQSGMSQSRLAEKIGVKQPTVSHYIKGDKLPSLDTFANLCVALDVDANEMLCINNESSL